MRTVLDASVGLKWVLVEQDTPKALRLRDESRNQIRELIAPDFFILECAHVIAKAERRGILVAPQGAIHLANILSDPPQMYPASSLIMRAFAIASRARIGVYDCLYVALAEREGCELITADERLVRAMQPAFPFVTSLAALP
jgi:predicted nucleic acid-binding protein